MKRPLPTKLKHDAIVEALLEVRFDSDDVGEIVVGRLGDLDLLQGYATARLGTAGIPENLRDSDPNLRFAPILERRSVDGLSTARIGSHVLSYHVFAPYPGWDKFAQQLEALVSAFFGRISNVQVRRLGLRYVNFMRRSTHLVSSLGDLTLNIAVEGKPLISDLNLAFLTAPSESHAVMTRVASPIFVQTQVKPEDLVAAVDVDVSTPDGYTIAGADAVIAWVKQAHEYEKDAFFGLLPEKLQAKLEE